ncbi:hypothetical protein ANAPC5_01288 [Anaplasma phagocytophilum]|nr:hypothetical protein ANAPC5_01288 [Anaplasma phagocytophilum]
MTDYKLTITTHRTLNTIQGVISEDDLLDSKPKQLRAFLLQRFGLAAARREVRHPESSSTRQAFITFRLPSGQGWPDSLAGCAVLSRPPPAWARERPHTTQRVNCRPLYYPSPRRY